MKVALCFAQFGPYHHARAVALKKLLGINNFIAVQIAAGSRTYAWEKVDNENVDLVTLCGGKEEDAGFLKVFLAALRLWKREKVTAALLPSYSPASSLALLLAAKAAGLKCVMLNESHAGTERAKGWKRWVKKRLVLLFDAALVGGTPQKRHFTALGMNPETVFIGYDAIDNDFFIRQSQQVRHDADGWRMRLGLPQRYILSLGRMVEKKNLGCLVAAYAALVTRLGEQSPALVFVGSGDEEPNLRDHCVRLGLEVVDSVAIGISSLNNRLPAPDAGRVFFYGFRQIGENPAFYALADCFVLPSIWEEWGLVVNEAMACSLPVLVSNAAGSAEDLVADGVNGWVFNPYDAKVLTARLAELAENPQLRHRLGLASAERIAFWGCDRFALGATKALVTAMGKQFPVV